MRNIAALVLAFIVAGGVAAQADPVRFPASGGDYAFVINPAAGWTTAPNGTATMQLKPPEAFGGVLLAMQRDVRFIMMSTPEIAKALGTGMGIKSFSKQEKAKLYGHDAEIFYGDMINTNNVALDAKVILIPLSSTEMATEIVFARKNLESYETRSLQQMLDGLDLVKQ